MAASRASTGSHPCCADNGRSVAQLVGIRRALVAYLGPNALGSHPQARQLEFPSIREARMRHVRLQGAIAAVALIAALGVGTIVWSSPAQATTRCDNFRPEANFEQMQSCRQGSRWGESLGCEPEACSRTCMECSILRFSMWSAQSWKWDLPSNPFVEFSLPLVETSTPSSAPQADWPEGN